MVMRRRERAELHPELHPPSFISHISHHGPAKPQCWTRANTQAPLVPKVAQVEHACLMLFIIEPRVSPIALRASSA